MHIDTAAIPVLEQLVRKVEARLKTITRGAGYRVAVRKVMRPTRRDERTRGGGDVDLAIDSFGQDGDEIAESGVKLVRTVNLTADFFVEPSDDDDRPMDLLCAVAMAEIERALAKDFYPDAGAAYDGLGSNARLNAPQFLRAADNSTAGVRINLAIDYRHSDLDPYTAL